MPTLFVSHGAPNLELARPPVASFLEQLPRRLPRPKAILCASAHWETRQPALNAVDRPETIHDFFGFPEALYRMTYPAPGHPRLAAHIQSLLAAAGIAARLDGQRGLDHGAWVPLRLMFPGADIPVLQLSLQTPLGPDHHLAVGRALKPLRTEGVLILGSGGITHNLREFHNYAMDAPPVERTAAFDDWVEACVAADDTSALADYARVGPHAAWNHPSAEHFLPLFVPMGAAAGEAGQCIHRSFTYGVLSMSAYGWGVE